MARIFITGSADGLGQLAARRLVASGHDVVLHGRNRERARDAMVAVPGAREALAGDLASIPASNLAQGPDAPKGYSPEMSLQRAQLLTPEPVK